MKLEWETWEKLFDFYNRMAAKCYASEGSKSVSSDDFPGAKFMRGVEGRYCYCDMWYTGTNGKLGVSGGHSLLSLDNIPVWILQYWGWYDKDDSRVIKTLKEALLQGYSNGETEGGRGPGYYTTEDGQYNYQNTVGYGNGLILPEYFKTEPWLKRGKLNFSGHEYVYRKETEKSPMPAFEVFRHDYVGFALIN